MKEEKWLLRKSSGSKTKGDYADDKSSNLNLPDELPLPENVKTSCSFLDTSLAKKWLYDHFDKNFDYLR